MNTNHHIIRTGVVAAATSLLLAAAPTAVGADDPQQWDPCRIIGTWPDCKSERHSDTSGTDGSHVARGPVRADSTTVPAGDAKDHPGHGPVDPADSEASPAAQKRELMQNEVPLYPADTGDPPGVPATTFPEAITSADIEPIVVADAYHGVGFIVCPNGETPVTVADAYHGIGIVVCPVPADGVDATSALEAPAAAAATDPVEIVRRLMTARNAGDAETAMSLLDDTVRVPLMANNDMATNLWSVPLSGDEVGLALEAEQLYGVRYDPFSCEGSTVVGQVTCTYTMVSRLRLLEGLPPIESSFQLNVDDGVVTAVSLPWLSIGFDPGGYWPKEFENFVRWLELEHPEAYPPYTWPAPVADLPDPGQLFYWEGQELIHILTRDTLDLLAGYLDDYEQFRATIDEVGLDEVVADYVGDTPGGVSVLVTRDGVTTTAAAGAANAAGDPITPATAFRVASITKPFIGTMVLQLVDEGRVDLEAPLSIYLPDTPVGGAVTIRQLLGHQSGIPDYTLSDDWLREAPTDPARWFSPAEILGYVEAMGPNGPDQGGYSNTNYILLGLLVEQLDGTDLATALHDRITGQLGLTSTRLATNDEPGGPDLAGGWTTGWLDGIPLDGDPAEPYDSAVSSGWASGALISTTGDLKMFLDALFAGKLISAASLDEMTGNDLGLFEVDLGSGHRGLGHNGWLGGYRSVMAIDPATGDTLIVLTNNDDIDPDRLAWRITLTW
jgi:D-alanyl-D-alanine carboxypeptidase